MLQQTRVAAVLEHYARWMQRFPAVADLARADESEVLALWSGLGYYRRARFLHKGAQAVVAEYAGKLPKTAAELRKLPGIGDYTSAAIASIAFGEAVAVIDGNVERVIMRLAGLAYEPAEPVQTTAAQKAAASKASATNTATLVMEKHVPLAARIRRLADTLLDHARPGDYNQAMMELGATVCLPRAPLCLHCPVVSMCATRGEHVSAPRKAMVRRSIGYALAERKAPPAGRARQPVPSSVHEVLLTQRRASESLMAGMWELPSAPESANLDRTLVTLRHAITVTNYTVSILGYSAEEAVSLPSAAAAVWVPVDQLPELPLTGLARKALKRMKLWPDSH